MTARISARNFTVTIDVLDSSGNTTNTVTLSNQGLTIALNTPMIDTGKPNGRLSWSGQMFIAQTKFNSISLDSRNTSGSPSGAQIWARGNRVNLSIADTGDTLRAFPTKLFINAVPQPPNPPQNTITVDIVDQLEAENYPKPEGDKSGFSEGTSTTRKAIIDNILSDQGLPAIASGDSLTAYPLTKPPQKTDTGAWIDYIGTLAATAGYTFWQDGTGAIRITPIDFNQASPKFSITVGGDNGTEYKFDLINQDERPPEELEVIGNGYDTTTNTFPRTSESFQYTTKGALLNNSDTDVTVSKYVKTVESFPSDNIFQIVETTKVPKIVIWPTTNSFRLSLRTAVQKTIRKYHRVDTGQLHRIETDEVWARGYINAITGSQEFTTNLDGTENYRSSVERCVYDANTEQLKDRYTEVDAIRASLGARLTPSDTEERVQEIEEHWRKKGRDQWRYESLDSKTAQEVYQGDVGDMSPYVLVPDENNSRTIQTNTGEADPPATDRLPDANESALKQYRGSTKFTPISGNPPAQQKLDTIEISGPFCVSDEQCKFLAELFGKFRQGRALAAQFTGGIPDWFLTSYSPLPRVDVTLNGIVTAYLADGIAIALSQDEAVMSCYLIEVGTVGAAPASVSPRYTVIAQSDIETGSSISSAEIINIVDEAGAFETGSTVSSVANISFASGSVILSIENTLSGEVCFDSLSATEWDSLTSTQWDGLASSDCVGSLDWDSLSATEWDSLTSTQWDTL